MSISRSDSYAAAGVDVTAGYESVNRIKPLVESTYVKGVMGGLGGFGGMFEPQVEGMKRPVTVSGTDGVGTKLKIAFLLDKHSTVGIDCVAMCVNDIICAGAMPMFSSIILRAEKMIRSGSNRLSAVLLRDAVRLVVRSLAVRQRRCRVFIQRTSMIWRDSPLVW